MMFSMRSPLISLDYFILDGRMVRLRPQSACTKVVVQKVLRESSHYATRLRTPVPHVVQYAKQPNFQMIQVL